MPIEKEANSDPPQLSDRVKRYREEVVRVVGLGVEHPCFELTQQASIGKENSKEKADFLKLIQGLANAHLQEERFLVIGADKKNRTFVAVANLTEFDPANVSKVLRRFLSPMPAVEVFDSLATDQGIPFVLLVFAARQHRPIVASGEVKDEEEKILLRKGDVWIKEGTGLREAISEDFQKMIQERVEAEANSIARTQFAHFRDEIIVAQQLVQPSGRRIPTADLVFGKDENFRLYVQDVIIGQDQARFEMAVELLRDLLVESWNRLGAYSMEAIENRELLRVQVLEHKRDYFLPALRRLVELGLLLVKHDGAKDWFACVPDLLVEVFESAGRLHRFWSLGGDEISGSHFDEYVGQAMPAVEALIGARTVAAYAIKRRRFNFVAPVLKKYVEVFSSTNKYLAPLLFWPLRKLIEMPDGRISFCWERRVQNAWGGYFGNREEFVQTACQLEFVLELNSYVGIGLAGARAKQWFDQYKPNVSFEYVPDLWRRSLNLVVPIAEELLEALKRGTGDILIYNLTVEKAPLELLLSAAQDEERINFMAGFLDHLQKGQTGISPQLFLPPECNWGDKLGPLVQSFRGSSRSCS